MKYFKTIQPQMVPGKGFAWMLYECDDNLKVVRMLNHIPEAAETAKYPNPVVKRLMQPEKLEACEEKMFLDLWGTG